MALSPINKLRDELSFYVQLRTRYSPYWLRAYPLFSSALLSSAGRSSCRGLASRRPGHRWPLRLLLPSRRLSQRRLTDPLRWQFLTMPLLLLRPRPLLRAAIRLLPALPLLPPAPVLLPLLLPPMPLPLPS
jgi:hypothetical protein